MQCLKHCQSSVYVCVCSGAHVNIYPSKAEGLKINMTLFNLFELFIFLIFKKFFGHAVQHAGS